MTLSEQVTRADRRRRRILAALVALGLALHFSCWPLGRRIPFESVDIGVDTGTQGLAEGCGSFQFGKHGIVVGTTADEVTEIANCVPMYNSPSPQPLSQIDISEQFVLVAVTEWSSLRPSSPPAKILRICQKGDRVIVTARLSPSPWPPFQMRLPAFNHPHHVVVIDRSALKRGGELEFVLVNRLGLSLASVRHNVTIEP